MNGLQSEVVQRQRRPPPRPPGILALLPETLTYYPYAESNNVGRNNRHKKKRDGNSKRCHQTSNTAGEVISNNNTARSDDNRSIKEGGSSKRKQHNSIITIEEFGCRTEIIPDHSLHLTNNNTDDDTINKNGFTLFFFVDSNNRQSLNAIPIVSRWYHYVLLNCHGISDDDDNIIQEEECRSSSANRIIFVPNQPSSHEINLHNSNSDSILQASINASSATAGLAIKGHVTISILQHTGFYHLPFLHKSRLPLLHLLGVTRVPSIIVVSNATGRVVTRYGWEAIEREGGPGGLLERWIDMSRLARKKDDDDNNNDETSNNTTNCFDSKVLSDWKCGKSGLPLWWHVFSFIL